MRRLLILTALIVGLVPASAQAITPDPNKVKFMSTIENANVYKILTSGLSPGNSWGMSLWSIDPGVVNSRERRSFYGRNDPPCVRFDTRVTYDGRYVGFQEYWRFACSTGTILNKIGQRTWVR